MPGSVLQWSINMPPTSVVVNQDNEADGSAPKNIQRVKSFDQFRLILKCKEKRVKIKYLKGGKLYWESYQLVGVNPSKSVHFILFPLTSYPIFASKI